MKQPVVVVSHSPLLSGGAEISLYEIIKFLSTSHQSVHVILPDKGAFSKKLKADGIPFSIIRNRWSVANPSLYKKTTKSWAVFNADTVISSYKLLLRLKPSVVLTNTIVNPWTGYAAKSLLIPHVLLVSESYHGNNNFKLLPDTRAYLNSLDFITDYVIYNSEFTRTQYGEVFLKQSSSVIYPVIGKVPENIFKHSSAFKNEKLSMLVYGSIVEHKNQLEAIEALNILKKETGFKDFTLTIMGSVGSKKYFNLLKKSIKEKGLTLNVSFIPFTERPFDTIQKHDIVLVPSVCEAFGRVTVEGQLAGRLVIASTGGANTELVKNKINGLLYETGDPSSLAQALLWAHKNRAACRDIAKAAQRMSKDKHYDINHNEEILNILADLDSSKDTSGESTDNNFNVLNALIQRNFHIEKILKRYADSLESSIAENRRLLSINKNYKKYYDLVHAALKPLRPIRKFYSIARKGRKS